MAEHEKKGFVARYLEGSEKSDDYALKTLPTNRWQLFKDIVTQRWRKLIVVNLILFLTMIPSLFVLLYRNAYIETQGSLMPFSGNLGIGYPAVGNTAGLAESLMLSSDLLSFAMLILTSFFAALGISGCGYLIRNMVWTEGVFVANDIWKGIKLNYFPTLCACFLFTTVLCLGRYLANLSSLAIASSTGDTSIFSIASALSYVIIVLAALIALWMYAVGSNYKVGFFANLRNSILLTIGTIPQTVFFVALMILPILLIFMGGELLSSIGLALLFLFTFAYMLLVWTIFTQWAFDKFVNSKIAGAKVNRGIYTPRNQTGEEDSAAVAAYKRSILEQGRSSLSSRPIKPLDEDDLTIYELPESFSREDLAKLRQSREAIVSDSNAYAEEHKNDERYVEYNKKYDDFEASLEKENKKKNGKKKTVSTPLDGKE